jgi:two-component system sensor histidine kinase BaeS
LTNARFSRLRAQLALAFVLVAVAAVLATVAVGNLSVRGDEQRDMAHQQVMQTDAAAVGASSAYAHPGWPRGLAPVIAQIAGSGGAAQIRDSHGHLVQSSANFASFPAKSEHRSPVTVDGRTVGSVTMRFGDVGANAVLARFNSQRLRARVIGVSIGVLIAMIAAFVVALRMTGPLTRLLKTARARGSGRPDARVGPVHGFRDMRELGAAFDQMADTLSRQDQVRRNLVADVAHQLRTPIAVIRAGSEAMLDGISEPTPANIESLHEETIRLTRMVNDLQLLSAAEAAAVQLTLKPSDLSAAAATAADSLSDVYRRAGVRLIRQLDPVTVPCDEPRMHDVIINLLSNAAKFTPAGGFVELNTRSNGKSAILRVRDSGIGIAADELPYISERFYRAANSAAHDGSGIGLAIVDELVRGHHGTLDISSEAGQGTEVTIKLPKALPAGAPS